MDHWTLAYLFFGNAHVVFDSGEDCGLDVQAFGLCLSPALHSSPLLLPTLNQLHDLVKLLLVNLAQQGNAQEQERDRKED